MAASFGIKGDGGINGSVGYTIIPGTADKTRPRKAALIQANGRKIFAQAKIPVQ